jgi:flagellar transcriptional activator FlhD
MGGQHHGGFPMDNKTLLDQIRDVNLSYLVLARELIREDKENAQIRLGLDENTVDMLAQLTNAQMLKIASSKSPLCSIRFAKSKVWQLACNQNKTQHATGIHAAILMAGQCIGSVEA